MKQDNYVTRKKRLQNLARLLDNSIPVPGLNFRIGLDGLVGLIPFVGDALGTLMSSYILAEAARMQVPKSLLVRMGFNIIIDALIGLIPFIGDISDFVWKANLRNVQLLEDYIETPQRVTRSSRLLTFALIVAVIVIVILITMLSIWLLQAVWTAITS